MLDPKATRFWHAASRSGLMDASALEACWNAIAVEKRTPDAIDRRMARQAITLGYLTQWQSLQLLKGRPLGFQVDKYVLLDHLGQGGMGRVYLAKDTRLNRRVALKVLSPERMNNPRALARFKREAKLGAQLQHENLVRIYDEGDCNGVRYLVMEYIEGKTAGHLLSEFGPMATGFACRLVRQVALGLEHARQKGLVHRDVNPWNILVTHEGVAKLTDLGLAIDLGDLEGAVTRDGATVGTFDYISPEQARHSHSADTRSDIYSLGCTLFHLLTGRVPFPMPSLPEKLYAHQLNEAEPMSKLVRGVPAGLDDIVRKMMQKSPDDRYPNPAAVALALEPFIEGPAQAVAAGAGALARAAVAADAGGAAGVPADIPVAGGTPVTPLPSPTTPLSPVSPAPDVSTGSGLDSSGFLPPLDLGPELPLSASRSEVKDRSRVQGEGRRWREPAIISAVVVFLAGGLLLSVKSCSAPGVPPPPVASGQDSTETQTKKSLKSVSSKNGDDQHAGSAVPSEPPAIAVHWPDGDERAFDTGNVYNDLKDAIQSASARGAEVVLRNRKPLEVKVPRAIVSGGGKLVIRAGKNEHPTLFVVLSGKDPFLQILADNTASGLELHGLSIKVAFGEKSGAPPLIRAAGNLAIDHCEFTTSGENPGARVAQAEGLSTSITHSYFEGFELPLDVAVFGGGRVKLSNSMFIQGEAGNPGSGWAASVRLGASGRAGKGARLLEVDHCTFTGEGVLQVADFTEQLSLDATLADSVVHTSAVMMWRAKKDNAFPKGLHWTGKGNWYDLQGAAWVVQPPSGQGSITDALPGSPTDLDTWVKALPGETGAKVESVKFASSAPSAEPHEPGDFAVVGQLGDSPIGADPEKVGPRRSATSAKEKTKDESK